MRDAGRQTDGGEKGDVKLTLKFLINENLKPIMHIQSGDSLKLFTIRVLITAIM